MVEFAILEWVGWFKTDRLREPLGNIPPAEADAHYYLRNEPRLPAVRPIPNQISPESRRQRAALDTEALRKQLEDRYKDYPGVRGPRPPPAPSRP